MSNLWNTNKKISIIKYPSGKYGFVGSDIPIDAVYQYINNPNKKISDEDSKKLLRTSSISMAKKILNIKSRVFNNEQEAEYFIQNIDKILKENKIEVKQKERYKRLYKEDINNTANDLAAEIEKEIQQIFPHSLVSAKFNSSIHPSITIEFALGNNKNEWINSIVKNDCAYHIAFIYNIEKDGSITKPLKYELSTGRIKIKSDDPIYAFSSIKLPFRSFTGDSNKMVQTIKRYYENLKKLLQENKNKIPERDLQLIGHKF